MRQLISYKRILDGYYTLVVTTNDSERKAVLEMLDSNSKLSCRDAKRRAYLGIVHRSPVVVLDGAGGFSDEHAATRFAMDILANEIFPKPSLVVICGVCWGNPNTVQAGEVILSSSVVSLNRSTLTPSGNAHKPYYHESRLDIAELDIAMQPGWKRGQMLSLESRITDIPARDKLLVDHPLTARQQTVLPE